MYSRASRSTEGADQAEQRDVVEDTHRQHGHVEVVLGGWGAVPEQSASRSVRPEAAVADDAQVKVAKISARGTIVAAVIGALALIGAAYLGVRPTEPDTGGHVGASSRPTASEPAPMALPGGCRYANSRADAIGELVTSNPCFKVVNGQFEYSTSGTSLVAGTVRIYLWLHDWPDSRAEETFEVCEVTFTKVGEPYTCGPFYGIPDAPGDLWQVSSAATPEGEEEPGIWRTWPQYQGNQSGNAVAWPLG